jgi:hypothetical protein
MRAVRVEKKAHAEAVTNARARIAREVKRRRKERERTEGSMS